jgi:chromosome segregation ATPase
MNKELINKITLLKKEVEYSKKEMRKKDEKILRYLNRYDKIATENAYNNAEILNLEEELMNKKNEVDMKTKKINELMNINMGLEQEMNKLKIYYKSKEKNKNLNKNDYINSNEIENKYNNEINYDFNNVEKDEEKINQYEDIEEQCNFEELNVEELNSKRNSLLKKRNRINVLYNKLPIKLDDEQIAKKIELENKLKKINSDLVKIRLQFKNISQ